MPGNAITPNIPSGNIPDLPWVNQVWSVVFTFGPYIACLVPFFVALAAWIKWQRHRAGRDITMNMTIGNCKYTGSTTAFRRFLGSKAQEDLFQKLRDLEEARANFNDIPNPGPDADDRESESTILTESERPSWFGRVWLAISKIKRA